MDIWNKLTDNEFRVKTKIFTIIFNKKATPTAIGIAPHNLPHNIISRIYINRFTSYAAR